jgi:Ca2+/Na+ antiporter
MVAFLRLLVFGFLILSVIYVVVSFWSRSVRRRKLEQEWNDSGRPGDKETYMTEGMAQYDRSLRRKLILLIYVVPVVVVGTIIYVTNFM